MNELLNVIDEYKKKHSDLVMIEIIESYGSTPRKKGAMMFVDKDRHIFGSIGGGEFEYKVSLDALNVFATHKTFTKEYGLNYGNLDNIDMICGGKNIVKFTFIDSNLDNTDIVSYIQSFDNKLTCYVFGAGHIAKCVIKLLRFIGVCVVCFDDRKDYASENNLCSDIKIICAPYDNINKYVNITEDDFVLVSTSSHSSDYLVEKQVLKTNAYYIGAIGSMNKKKLVIKKLLDDGFTMNQINRLNIPVGIQVSAMTPEEIAISIVCEVILFRAKKEQRTKFINNNTVFETLYKRRDDD